MILSLFIVLAFNLYAIFLLPQISFFDLAYWDLLVLSVWGCCLSVRIFKKRSFKKKIEQSLSQSGKIAPFYLPYIDQDLYFHDIEQLENKLSQERERNNELKDSIDRIVHELKASLGTMLLCQDESDQRMLQLGIETMNRQLSFLLLLARLETNVMDVQFKKIELRPLIYSSIKNNKHLLIYNHFEVKIDCPELLIYTDPEWLIYIFDQLILNAIKYKREARIEISADQKEDETIIQFKDHGIGIERHDLPQVFEKGFTGSNTRSGTYRSTGMGLYFVHTVLDKLSGTVEVFSVPGSYTIFTLHLFNSPEISWHKDRMVS